MEAQAGNGCPKAKRITANIEECKYLILPTYLYISKMFLDEKLNLLGVKSLPRKKLCAVTLHNPLLDDHPLQARY